MRQKRRNGLIRVPAAWTDSVLRAFRAGGGEIHLSTAAFPYTQHALALAALYPAGVPVVVEAGEDNPEYVNGALSEPIERGGTYAISITRGGPAEETREAVEHELRHMVQGLGAMALGGESYDQTFGMPKRAAVQHLAAGQRMTKRELMDRGLRGRGMPEARRAHWYFHDPKEWSAWVADTVQAVLRAVRGGESVNNAVRRIVPATMFYRHTAPETRRDLIGKVYAEVSQQVEAARKNPRRPRGPREAEIQRALTLDLLKPAYRRRVEAGAHPHTGHCYVSSEAYYFLHGGKAAGLKPMTIRHEGEPHWWVRDAQGRDIDLTAAQFRTPVPYEKGVGKGFLTAEPSKRARVIMDRVRGAKANPSESAGLVGPRAARRLCAFVGRCYRCHRPVRMEIIEEYPVDRPLPRDAKQARQQGWRVTLVTACPHCGAPYLKLKRLIATYAARIPCTAKCWSAVGAICNCSCGGEHHGKGIAT